MLEKKSNRTKWAAIKNKTIKYIPPPLCNKLSEKFLVKLEDNEQIFLFQL